MNCNTYSNAYSEFTPNSCSKVCVYYNGSAVHVGTASGKELSAFGSHVPT